MIDKINFTDLPALCEPLDGGIFSGITTLKDGAHVAVVLLPRNADWVTWKKAAAWAADQGGQLPTRAMAVLLYANCKSHLRPAWHWTADELQDDTGDKSDVVYAWHCDFRYGYQTNRQKIAEGAAVAVRLIPIGGAA